ncbi:MAG: twin-arginine translocation signal domain-containing protein, partial [Gammaproteobacteria bacterium]|nr:twin-arginine translocation signal domain-containing protein [Gammaproteobacteria bacterium]
MLTRRRFLGQTALGMLALAGGCTPATVLRLREQAASLPDPGISLGAKAQRVAVRNRLLGYPVNMMMPSEGFLAWRQQLAEVG